MNKVMRASERASVRTRALVLSVLVLVRWHARERKTLSSTHTPESTEHIAQNAYAREAAAQSNITNSNSTLQNVYKHVL